MVPRNESKGSHFRIHVDEHEPAPPADSHVAEADQVVGHRLGKVVSVDHLRDVTFEVPPPPVVRASDLGRGECTHARHQPGAAVRTSVEEGLDVVIVAAHDDDRLVADGVLEEVAGLGELLFAASHLPHAGPQALHLDVEELTRGVASTGDDDHPTGFPQRMSVRCHGHRIIAPSRTARHPPRAHSPTRAKSDNIESDLLVPRASSGASTRASFGSEGLPTGLGQGHFLNRCAARSADALSPTCDLAGASRLSSPSPHQAKRAFDDCGPFRSPAEPRPASRLRVSWEELEAEGWEREADDEAHAPSARVVTRLVGVRVSRDDPGDRVSQSVGCRWDPTTQAQRSTCCGHSSAIARFSRHCRWGNDFGAAG